MAPVAERDSQKDFARSFGDALKGFLTSNGMKQIDAAKSLGLMDKNGNPNKARLNTYCHDSRAGKRPKPAAEILFLACTKLEGFYFDYRGYRISAATLNGNGRKPTNEPASTQLTLQFDRQFNLTEEAGSVTVRVKRPPGRIELSILLRAIAS